MDFSNWAFNFKEYSDGGIVKGSSNACSENDRGRSE